MPKKSRVRGKKKHRKNAGKKRQKFSDENRDALLNVTESGYENSKTIFRDMVDAIVPSPAPSGPEWLGAALGAVAVAAVAGVGPDHRGHGRFC